MSGLNSHSCLFVIAPAQIEVIYASLWNNQSCLSRALEPPGSKSFSHEFWFAKSQSNKLLRLCTNIKTNGPLFVPPAVSFRCREQERKSWNVRVFTLYDYIQTLPLINLNSSTNLICIHTSSLPYYKWTVWNLAGFPGRCIRLKLLLGQITLRAQWFCLVLVKFTSLIVCEVVITRWSGVPRTQLRNLYLRCLLKYARLVGVAAMPKV